MSTNGYKYGKRLLVVALVLAGLAACVKLDFTIWRLKHPEAPAWTYLF